MDYAASNLQVMSMQSISRVPATSRVLSWLTTGLLCFGLAACGGADISTPVAQSSQGNPASFESGQPAGGNGQQAAGLFFIAGSIDGPGSVDGTAALARFNSPRGIAFDLTGNLYVADYLNYTIRKITPAGVVTTFAGKSGMAGSADGIGEAARFGGPFGIAADNAGNLYVTDLNAIRKITPAGAVSTLAGSANTAGSSDGSGAAARFNNPAGIAADASGNVYIADFLNNIIRKITPAGTVTTLAGTAGVTGSADGTGAAAQFNRPQGIVADGSGNLYIADRDNLVIRKITPAGVVTTIAGTPGIAGAADNAGTPAQFFAPQNITVDAIGNLYVADAFTFPGMCPCGPNGIIRKISPAGVVSTLAGTAKASGSADGTGPGARFDYPLGITVNPAGDVYVADALNNTIRKITPTGTVTTVAGTARVIGSADGTAPTAGLNDPIGIAADASGNLYIVHADKLADAGNAVVRKLASTGMVTTVARFAGVTGTGFIDGSGQSARFDQMHGITIDTAGNLYIADANNAIVGKITPAGAVSTLAGTAGSHGNVDGSGLAARFQKPVAIASDKNGNLYVIDAFHDSSGADSATIRRITPAGAVTTIAGTAGMTGDADGIGAAAQFTNPRGITADSQNNLYITDASSNTIRKISPAGVVTTLAGKAGVAGNSDGIGSAALFNKPQGITIDQSGNLYIADTLNNAIRKIAAGAAVSTIAGATGREGILLNALSDNFYRPIGITVIDQKTLAVTTSDSVLGLRLP
ncbi:MAG: repeat containing protein [Herminiimonas sp.]|nr:repeat containing protein [Herminiimonas sp.]